MATLSILSPPSSLFHRPRNGSTSTTTRLILTSPSLNLHTNSPNFRTINAFSSPSLSPLLTQDDLKKLAADKAVEYVSSSRVLGLGTGSAAAFVVDKLGELLKTGQLKDIVGISTSKLTQEQAASLGIPLSILDDHSKLNLVIDSADEVDPELYLVKGRGGAFLCENGGGHIG